MIRYAGQSATEDPALTRLAKMQYTFRADPPQIEFDLSWP